MLRDKYRPGKVRFESAKAVDVDGSAAKAINCPLKDWRAGVMGQMRSTRKANMCQVVVATRVRLCLKRLTAMIKQKYDLRCSSDFGNELRFGETTTSVRD
jgi:hypothetical protein